MKTNKTVRLQLLMSDKATKQLTMLQAFRGGTTSGKFKALPKIQLIEELLNREFKAVQIQMLEQFSED